MRSRHLLIGAALGCAALFLCACAFLLVGGGVSFLVARDVLDPALPTRDPNRTPPPAPTPGAETLAEMDAIQAWVIRQRGLQPNDDGVTRRFLSREQMLDRTLEMFAKETTPEEVADDVRVLAVLGLLKPGTDLYRIYVRMQSEGVVGFYDPETGELVVVSDDSHLNAYERSTFAHEYNHALQDQNYDFEALGFSEEGWEADSERAAGVRALLEGDSSLLDEQYTATLSADEKREYDRQAYSLESFLLVFRLPPFLLQDFAFPYTYGKEFVRRYYDEGGWARVDEVWADPPVSTEQILHPGRYEAGDDPLPVPRPVLTDTLGSGWRQIDQNVMGEWYTYLILAWGDAARARLPDDQAASAAEGWGGDAYTVFHNDEADQTVLALHTEWDTAADADEFAAAFAEYAGGRFGEPARTGAGGACWEGAERHCLYVRGAHTLWLAAPDQAMIDTLRAAFPDVE